MPSREESARSGLDADHEKWKKRLAQRSQGSDQGAESTRGSRDGLGEAYSERPFSNSKQHGARARKRHKDPAPPPPSPFFNDEASVVSSDPRMAPQEAVDRMVELQQLTRAALTTIQAQLQPQVAQTTTRPRGLAQDDKLSQQEAAYLQERSSSSLARGASFTRTTTRGMRDWSHVAIANVVWRCCQRQPEASEVYEKAVEVANLFWLDEVSGRALLELLNAEAARDAWLSSVLEKLGSRAALAGELRSYVAEHGWKPWAEAVKDSIEGGVEQPFPQRPNRSALAGEDNKIFSTRFCHYTRTDELRHVVDMMPPDPKSHGNEQRGVVALPLFVTVLVKELKEEVGNADQVMLMGTMLVRSLIDTDLLVGSDGEALQRPVPKINEREDSAEMLAMRSSKVAMLDHARQEPSDTNKCLVAMRTTTYSLEAPMKRRTIFSKAPFNITAFELTLEFKTLRGRVPVHDEPLSDFVPDLLCPLQDLRNLISVRDYSLDELNRFDIINPNPSVEVVVGQKDGLVCSSQMKLTFYGDTDAVRSALNIIIPIIFVAFGNMLNVLYTSEYNDFLANALSLGLTLVFFLPTLNEIESVSNEVDLNQVLVVLLFTGLVLGCVDCRQCEVYNKSPLMPHSWRQLRGAVRVLSFVFLWGSIVIPVSNFVKYIEMKHRLEQSSMQNSHRGPTSPGQAARGGTALHSFTGKPKYPIKHSTQYLEPFWDPTAATPQVNPRLNAKFTHAKPWRTGCDGNPKTAIAQYGLQPRDIPGSTTFESHKDYYKQTHPNISTRILGVLGGASHADLQVDAALRDDQAKAKTTEGQPKKNQQGPAARLVASSDRKIHDLEH